MKNLFLLLALILFNLSVQAQNDQEKIVIKKENRVIVENIDVDEDHDKIVSIEVEKEGDE